MAIDNGEEIQTAVLLLVVGLIVSQLAVRVRRELVGLPGLRGCRFQYGSLIGHFPRLEHDGGLWLRRGDRITEYAGLKRPAWWPSP
ncbi:hypothetical protein [Streptomyces erythrochromogenes]|uniref:hypothetical protein n=1 Tax=Streptomyces erythrochromogenes TaxID=285574 RepID=UPI002253C4BB|nr:hypothetical protein [Streptomyces erythrochromogenes]MCX5588606.1 hypothetical protein [Streptomyces erythrochromogenes]